METAIFILIGIIGLVIGSFLNVLIYRVPEGKSIAWPASHCPNCDQPLKWRDNVPLLSFIILRGKCRSCGQPISWQYPLVELSAAVISIMALLKFDLSSAFLAAAFFMLVLLTVAVIDLQRQIIPNRIIIPAMIFSAAVALFTALIGRDFLPVAGRTSLLMAAVGFAAGGGLLLLVAVIRPGGMGGGDIKLAGFMGIFLGPYVIMALFIGFLLGSLAGLTSIILLHKSRRDLLPFGPFLSFGAILTLFFGGAILKWYLGLSGMG